MQKRTLITLTLIIALFTSGSVFSQNRKNASPIPAAYMSHKYMRFLKNKRVAMVVNQTSTIYNVHLVDSLRHLGIDIKKIFCPEHGFRGNMDAGETINSSVDSATQIPLISLYGKHKKPDTSDLKDIDIVVFDIQDVGVRFYTYLSTLHYVMEACAENNVQLLVLDRPNPNGYYIDGPIMQPSQTSFIGLHPVPIVYGMTIGEYAKMINGEEWLANKIKCKLHVIRNAEYTHEKIYTLPIKPSPNLVDQDAVTLYPSVCLFEGTVISLGRGTYEPFKMIGHPDYAGRYEFNFVPQSIVGMSKEPPLLNRICYGKDLRTFVTDSTQNLHKINISWLLEMYKYYPNKELFFNPYFEKLVGTNDLRKQIIEGKTEVEIRSTWQEDLAAFKRIRNKYLLYP